MEKNNKILQLQNAYEKGLINEEDLSELEKQELIDLYKEQIKNLEQNISIYKNTLEYYKNKIIKKRTKLESNH